MTANDKAFDVTQSDAALPPDLAQYARDMQRRIAETLARRGEPVHHCIALCGNRVSGPDEICVACASEDYR